MTREETLQNYKVDANGRIASPGKFQGEMIYVPDFWEAVLDGCGEDQEDGSVRIEVEAEDRVQYPELRDRATVTLIERQDGFVVEI